MTTVNASSPNVRVLSLQTHYNGDPLNLFYHLSDGGKKVNTLLLESSEIDSKKAQKSLLLEAAALRIVCKASDVIVSALTENGRNALEQLKVSLNDKVAGSGDSISFTYDSLVNTQEETARLQAASPIDVLRHIQTTFYDGGEPYSAFLAGVVAYDFIETFEKLPEARSDDSDCPNYVFYLAERLLVIDHKNFQARIVANVFSGSKEEAIFYDQSRRLGDIKALNEEQLKGIDENVESQVADLKVSPSDDEFSAIVQQLKTNIVAGDVFQIVPSRCFTLPCSKPFLSYHHLRCENPSPYMFYVNDEDFILFGASPESAVKFDAMSRQVEVYPIAGTRPRGRRDDGTLDADLDTRIEAELRMDEKELTEHMMLVDLARNDIARISKAGTRHVAELLKVDRYSHVMHLVSRVVGELLPELDAYHAYLACMNMGTLVGAPKIRAAEILRTVEQRRRGAYGGAVGYIDGEGNMDTCIVIRSALVRNGQAYVKAGAGVVYDSVPASEVQETHNKAKAVINAITRAHQKEVE